MLSAISFAVSLGEKPMVCASSSLSLMNSFIQVGIPI